jgi:hypothetical protein
MINVNEVFVETEFGEIVKYMFDAQHINGYVSSLEELRYRINECKQVQDCEYDVGTFACAISSAKIWLANIQIAIDRERQRDPNA